MTLEYTVCPNCGCRCEDDEYCAACGKLFYENTVPARNVSFLGLMGSGLRSLLRKPVKHKEGWQAHSPENAPYSLDQDSDLDVDSSWAILSTNIHNRNR